MAELVTEELRRLDVTAPTARSSCSPSTTTMLRDLRARLGADGPQMVSSSATPPRATGWSPARGCAASPPTPRRSAPAGERVLRSAADQQLPGKAPLVHEAHRADLSVFCWTLRAENAFLPERLRRGTSPSALGNAIADARALLQLGVDGLITDSPDFAVRAIQALLVAA